MFLRVTLILILLLAGIEANIYDLHKRGDIPLHHVMSTDPSSLPDQGRMLQDVYQSIRIFADYTYLTNTTEVQKDYIQNELMPSALQYYQKALKVKRLAARLSFDLDFTCAEYDPPEYFNSSGVDADLVLLVVAENDPESDFVAVALPCGLSVIDERPVYGILAFNLAYLPMEKVTDRQENLSTALHELAHVLGFNAVLYQFFRDPITKQAVSVPPIGSKVINGVNISYINVEPLTSKLRTYFKCSTLQGAYLEDDGGVGSAGSHFERRVFMNEFMTASSITEPIISEFTLALLEGSGWYKPDYTMTEPFTWGKGQGCPFLEGSCIDGQGEPNYREFCDLDNQKGCTFTGRGIGFCMQGQFQDPFADTCPYYLSGPMFDCENLANQASALFSGETYGPQSRCFTGTLRNQFDVGSSGAYCFPITCEKTGSNFSLTVTVGNQSVACTKSESISVYGFDGILNCPDPNDYCSRANPVFCEKGCSGRGECVSGKCQCPQGWRGVDCAERANVTNCSRCKSGICYGDQCVGVASPEVPKPNPEPLPQNQTNQTKKGVAYSYIINALSPLLIVIISFLLL